AGAGNVEFGGQQWHGHFAFPGSTWRPTSLVNQESWMPLFYHILSIPAKLLTCLNTYTPQRIGIWGGCSEQVSNPPNSIGTAVQHVMATGLHLLFGGIQCFSTASHPAALVACYVAS
ncbi:MAG: hypothetical protein WBW48_02720, partial [Anaerolineae bacterium]